MVGTPNKANLTTRYVLVLATILAVAASVTPARGTGVTVEALPNRAIVPGAAQAAVRFSLTSLQDWPRTLDFEATSTHGFPLTIDAPHVLAPGEITEGRVWMEIPPDARLVGEGGIVSLHWSDPLEPGRRGGRALPYIIEPAVTLTAEPMTLPLGLPEPRAFRWPITLRNHSDVPVVATLTLEVDGLTLTPSIPVLIDLPPGAHEGFEAQLIAPPDSPAGVKRARVRLVTDGGLGDQELDIDHRVLIPVVVDLAPGGRFSFSGEGSVFGAAPGVGPSARIDYCVARLLDQEVDARQRRVVSL